MRTVQLVMWSGGLKSTYHLFNLCNQTDDEIYALYVYDDNVPYNKQQKAHLKSLKNRLQSLTGKTIKLRQYQIDADGEPATLEEKAMLAISYAYGFDQNVMLHYHFDSSTIQTICQASNIEYTQTPEYPPSEQLSKHFTSLYWLTWNCDYSSEKDGCGQCDRCYEYQQLK